MKPLSNGIPFTTTHRCGFRDVDPFGHMGMVSYYAYYADHRFTALRDRFGLDMAAIGKLPVGFFTREAKVEYRRQVRGDEAFSITSKVVAMDDNGCVVDCHLHKADGTLASSCSMNIACVDLKTGRLSSWPDGFMQRFFEDPA